MNKFLNGLLVILLLTTPSVVFAQQPLVPQLNTASLQNVEHIDNYHVVIEVQKNGEIYIKEHIEYDFGTTEHHGIFRNIPYKYNTDLGKFNLRISDVSVNTDAGTPASFTKSTSSGDVVLKIGDPDKTITGKHIYDISYSVTRAINFFADHDELYWNAIGGEWTVPILQSSVLVNLPSSATQVECFVGPDGTKNTDCAKTGQTTTQPQFFSKQTLNPGEGFTIVVGVPAGTITKPTTTQKIIYQIQDNGIVALPFIVFFIMLYIWFKFGKDEKGRGTIVAQYEPPVGLSPLYVGTLVDAKLDNRDYSAELIYLAVKGYIKIEKIETKTLLFFKGSDYKITRLKEFGPELPQETQGLLGALFVQPDMGSELLGGLLGQKDSEDSKSSSTEVKLSDLKTNRVFGSILRLIPTNVFKELKKSGYYKYNPNTARGLTITAAMVVGFGGAVVGGNFFGATGIVCGAISGLIILIFSFIMVARTAKGSEMREYILGLKLYLGIAEKDRLNFTDAPEKNPERFEALLPYAIALGVETEWAKQFEGIYNQQPNWYNDSTGTAFNVALLSSSIGDFSNSMQSAFSSVTTASGGGSGFSGGGGGGGGGSW